MGVWCQGRPAGICAGALAAFLTVTLTTSGAGARDGLPSPFIVTLPNGEAFDVSAEAGAIQWRIEQGMLDHTVGELLDGGLIGDAAAVIAYATRYRPQDAAEFALIAAWAEVDHGVVGFAALALPAVLADPRIDPAAVRVALAASPLPSKMRSGLADLFPTAEETHTGGEADEVRSGDASAETGRPDAALGFSDGGLPALLSIGGAAGAVGALEPAADSGAS